MRNLFSFLWRHSFYLLFFLLESFAIILFVRSNNYQHAYLVSSTNQFTGAVYQKFNNISQYFYLSNTNKILAQENASLRSISASSYIKIDTNVFYVHDSLYQLQYQYVCAKVISNTVNRRSNYLMIDKGYKQGITKDMAVITSGGVVGIIKEVSENFSTALSILHKDTKISGKIKNNGYVGTVIWDGGNYRYGDLKDIPTHVTLAVGDTIVTSGYSLLFPSGIPIGVIDHFKVHEGENFYSIRIRFSIDYNKLAYVYVIRNLYKEEQFRLMEKTMQNE